MDQKTLDYYSLNADAAFNRYLAVEGGISEYFSEVFEKGERILEIGFGSGRDLKRLLDMGVEAVGVDPCPQFVDFAQATIPQLKNRVFAGHLPDGLSRFSSGSFDGVLCSAVLMHIGDSQLDASLTAIEEILRPGGKLLISVPESRSDMAEMNRDTKGRLMILRSHQDYVNLLLEKEFILKKLWKKTDAMSREGIQWTTAFLVKTDE